MELCVSTLKEYINNNQLSFIEKINISQSILNGLEYMHNNIIHRDPNNILIDKNNNIKISDFGLATNIYQLNYDAVGTIEYIAPEVLSTNLYSFKSDLYSFGIILLDIFVQFNTTMEKILVIKDIQNNRKNKNIKINDYLLNIIKNLLDNNPKKRYSIID